MGKHASTLTIAAIFSTAALAQTWIARVEEPTGIYRRVDEIVSVPLARIGSRRGGYRVIDAQGREVAAQTTATELLFPASLMPGQLPEYRILCCDAAPPGEFPSPIVARKLGLSRFEIANSRFRVIVDITIPAIVEAYSLTAGPQRSLNLVETSPEDPKALKGDIHLLRGVPPFPKSQIAGENAGWTSLGGTGPIESIEVVESGPLRAIVWMKRGDETWEFVWTSTSAALRWRARRGFRFAAISAFPYIPFDRFVNGSEESWPDGPESGEPADHEISAREYRKIPGGHSVYYNFAENYGALGVVALDSSLEWKDLGSRRFLGERGASDPTEIAITFPEWKAGATVLEARRENRVLRQPLLVSITGSSAGSARVALPAARTTSVATERVPASTEPASFHPAVMSMDGDWELAYGDKNAGPTSDWRTVRVPGSAQTQWLPADKWYTHEAEWVSAKEWWYRKRFHVPAELRGSPRIRLQFDATDYYADAYLNGVPLGRHEGYIDPYEYDVTGKTKPDGQNELLVRVWTPVSYYWRHRPYTVKGSYGAVDQKPDDITPLGITRGVRLVGSTTSFINDIAIDTRLGDDGGADVEVQLRTATPPRGGRWELLLRPRNFPGSEGWRVQAPASSNRLKIHVEHPELWWTWDHGKPNLYILDIRLLDSAGRAIDGRTMAVGIREIERIGWTFYLNRKRMFIRGTNSYYNLFLSEMNRAGYERDLRLMLGMNINMIRLHCHYTNPEFYDLADEMGVLIWQDYLEAWYPHDREFSLRAAELYDNHIRYVRNHPSIAVWTTSDEEDLENYRDLTKHLAGRPAALDPQHRPIVRSTGRFGDAHVYHGWYGGSIWEYTKMEEEFVSELGATALPDYESLVKFLPDAWPIQDHQEEWIFHKLQISEAMRAWGKPDGKTLREYIPQTQEYVARLFQIALERMRRLKYHPAGGILHFHAIDIWPSVTMAAVDYYRVPTKAYGTVSRSFAPVLASLEYDRDRWSSGEEFRCGVWIVNDEWQPYPDARIEWRVEGPEKRSGSMEAGVEADGGRKVGDVTTRFSTPGRYILYARVVHHGKVLSENQFEFDIEKGAR